MEHLGSFAEAQLNFYRALQLMVENAEAGGTHVIKKHRYKALMELLQRAITDLTETKSRGCYWDLEYNALSSFRSSWDFRRIYGENWRLKKRIEELEKQIKDDGGKGIIE